MEFSAIHIITAILLAAIVYIIYRKLISEKFAGDCCVVEYNPGYWHFFGSKPFWSVKTVPE